MSEDDGYQRINLRIPRELHERLMEAAKLSSKSMNAEIIARLSASFEDIPARVDALEQFTGHEEYGNQALFASISKLDARVSEHLEVLWSRIQKR